MINAIEGTWPSKSNNLLRQYRFILTLNLATKAPWKERTKLIFPYPYPTQLKGYGQLYSKKIRVTEHKLHKFALDC
jgi:hypothetical protein